MNKARNPRPFVMWAGGKRQLLDVLHDAAPAESGRYFEPFVGGGAFLFSRQPERATISDRNADLINCYRVVRDDVDDLVRNLRMHRNEETYFYALRAMDPAVMTPVQRAARFIYLNRTCFNGLYRENRNGRFNVPFGHYVNRTIVDEENLRAVSEYLRTSDIEIRHGSYRSILDEAQPGDFVYLDPPYVPMTGTANFARYVMGGFGMDDQKELAATFVALTDRGVLAMLSNSNVPVIHELYKGFHIRIVHAARSINCRGGRRGREANEVLVTNFHKK